LTQCDACCRLFLIMTHNAVMKKRRKESQTYFEHAEFLSYFALLSLKKKIPNPSQGEIYEAIRIALKPNVKLKPNGKSLQEIVETIDASQWHKNPIGFTERLMKGFVQRHEIWDTLSLTGLSINKAAQILEKGESFRRWAKKGLAPNELTTITRNDLQLLEFAAKSIQIFKEMSLQEEFEEERARLLTSAESMEVVRSLAVILKKVYERKLQEEKELHPENSPTFFSSLVKEA